MLKVTQCDTLCYLEMKKNARKMLFVQRWHLYEAPRRIDGDAMLKRRVQNDIGVYIFNIIVSLLYLITTLQYFILH